MRKGLCSIPLVVIVALALMGTNATGSTLHLSELAPAAREWARPLRRKAEPARKRASCGREGGEVFYAFTLHGIACAKAHALITAYSHRVSTGRGCEGRGTACGDQVSGSWCSLPGYAGAPVDAGCCENGGHPLGSCSRHGGSFTVRATSPPPGWSAQLHLTQFETPDGSISCDQPASG